MSASPAKRVKSPPPPQSFAWSVIAEEPALIQLIARFLPSDSDVRVGDAKQQTVLSTIASLCRALPHASRSLGPSNEAFWRRLVLAHFDFTLGKRYNVGDDSGLCRYHLPSEYRDDRADSDDSSWAIWCRHPLKPEMDAWKAAYPDADWVRFFVENYGQWTSLGVDFRPSQFAFLREIQQDPALMDVKWPVSERAFSLFSDFVVLQKLVRPDETFQTDSDGEQFVTPVLLRRLETDVTEGIDFGMLKLCGYIPPCWYAGRGVSHRWTGLNGPPPSVDLGSKTQDAVAEDGADDAEEVEEEDFYDYYDYATDEDYYIFPGCQDARDLAQLRRLVYDTMSDWRRVHVNRDETQGPVFYIGQSKRSGRWLGFTGVSDHIRYVWHPSDHAE